MAEQLPTIAVLGAGAVGCYFGGLLAKAGFSVTLIARQHQVGPLLHEGLTIEWQDRTETVVMNATADIAAIGDASYVFVAVKTLATLATAQEMAPHLAPQACVISLQNGLENAQSLKKHILQACYSCMVYAAVAMQSTHHVKHFGGGNLILGNTIPTQSVAPLSALLQLLQAAHIPTHISENIYPEMWHKFIINCIFNAASALAQVPYSVLMQSPGMQALAHAVMQECFLVARCEGVRIDAAYVQHMLTDIPLKWPLQQSSMAQDLAKFKATEIDDLNGTIVLKAKQHGVATPCNAMLHSLIKMRESSQGNFN